MTEKENILQELNDIGAVVAAVPRRNVFSVDADYFSGIEAELTARIAADKFYVSQQVFDVPAGYFDSLEANILQKIQAESLPGAAAEMQELSPLIAGIGNKNVFTVPAGYFENIQMPSELQQPAKVVQMNKIRVLYKYAAAAVITGLIGLSVIKVIDNRQSAAAPDTHMASLIQKANDINKSGSFDAELSSVSGNEIEKYLTQNGQDVDAALVASVTDDEAALPEATDYLLDENTLDDFLKTNNLKDN